jgi:capsular exopolysaccharide synthesis family protein
METKSYPQEQEVDIQQYWLVLKRRWQFVVIVLLATVGLVGAVLLMRKPSYEATGRLLFKSDRISSLTKVGERIGDLESLVHQNNPLETQAVILKSQPILREVISTLQLKDKKGKLLEPESLKLRIEPIVGTDIINVTYRSNEPELAAKVVNQLMKSYVANNIESNLAQVYAAGEFIKKQLPASRQELEEAAEQLRLFKDKNKIIQLPQEASAAISNIAQLDGEMNQARASLADIQAQEAKVASELNLQSNQATEMTALSQVSGVQDVLAELQKVQTKLATETARYTASHPSVVNLKNQEITLNALLQQRIKQSLGTNAKVPTGKLQMGKIKQDLASQYIQLKTQREGLEKKINALSAIRVTYQQRLAALPKLEKIQGNLERRLTVAQTSYQNLITRLQEIEVAEKQTIGNARVIQPAEVPHKPVISKRMIMFLGGGLFAGLLLSVATAFFVDLIDSSIKTIKEAKTIFGYTLLGLIPKFESPSTSAIGDAIADGVSPRVIVASSVRTIIHEAYQMLQANLKFISHKKVRTIVITSSVANEGKSEVSANLATVLTQTGKRVLLVDADMRNPSQHHLWGLINAVGLSNVIVGQDEFSRAVQSITNSLSVLTAGVQPPNPSALLDSERMNSLIQTFSENYDYIIFDTPPLTGTADAAVLGKMVDGVLLVVRPGVVTSASATAAKSLLERSEANILGIIANAVNLKQEPDSYFYYSQPRGGQNARETERTEQWTLR